MNYYRKDGIMQRDRKYSAVPPLLSMNSSPANLDVSRFAVASALNQSVNAPIPGVSNFDIFLYAHSGATANNNGRQPASQYTYSHDQASLFNYNEFAMSYPEIERKGVCLRRTKLFGDGQREGLRRCHVSECRHRKPARAGRHGVFFNAWPHRLVIPARTTNPILTLYFPAAGVLAAGNSGHGGAARRIPGPGTQVINGTAQRLAPAGAVNTFNPFNQDIADTTRARLAEFGNRVIRDTTDALMFTSGIKADNIAGKWNFDASFSFSSIEDHRRAPQVSATRFNQLVNANSPIFDPRSSSYIGTTTPYNPFGYYRNPIGSNAGAGELRDRDHERRR